MQTLRDALALLVAILVIATVRVSPTPEIELSPAQASQSAQTVSAVGADADPILAGPDSGRTKLRTPADLASPAQSDPKAPCTHTMAVTSHSEHSPGRPAEADAPCDV